jgi:selenocysteine-specific elongation factor
MEAPIVSRAVDRFVIRSYSPVTTIGGGRIAEPAPARRKRLGPEDARSLLLCLDGSPADAVRALVDAAGWTGFDAARLPIATRFEPETVRSAAAGLEAAGVVVRIGARLFRRTDLGHARTLLLDAVDRHHADRPIEPGIAHEELRRALPPRCPSSLADTVLAGLLGDGTLLTRPGGFLARAGFAPALPVEQRAVAEHIVALIASAGLTPPLLGELPPPLRDHPDLRAILRFLEREARLVPVSADLYVAPGALRDAVSAIRRQVPADRALTPTEFKEILGISRKYLIPLLEHFDRTNVTVRRAEGRYLCAEARV